MLATRLSGDAGQSPQLGDKEDQDEHRNNVLQSLRSAKEKGEKPANISTYSIVANMSVDSNSTFEASADRSVFRPRRPICAGDYRGC